MIVPLSSPVAKNYPETETERAKTGASCPSYTILMLVGNGFKSFGSGSFGMRVSGSILSFFFLTLGHKYRSRHL